MPESVNGTYDTYNTQYTSKFGTNFVSWRQTASNSGPVWENTYVRSLPTGTGKD